MEKAILGASLVLAGSIVCAAVWTGLEFRYDVEVWGRTIMVHGMQPISPPTTKTTHKLTDQEFNEMMDRITRDYEAQGD